MVLLKQESLKTLVEDTVKLLPRQKLLNEHMECVTTVL